MKIIITENKLNRTIIKWLSEKYDDLEIYDHDNQPWVLYVDKDGETIFLYHYNDKELYVAKNVIKFLIDIFSIDERQIKPIIGDWFQERNDLRTNKVLPWTFNEDWKKVVRWETKKRLS